MIRSMGRVLPALLVMTCALWASDRQAERAFREGRRLERAGKFRQALEAFTRASELEPREPRFLLHREMARQRAAFLHTSAALRLMRNRLWAEAVRELEQAHETDPTNDFVQQELAGAREAAGVAEARQALADRAAVFPELEPPLALRPRPTRRSWELRGEPRALYLAVGAAFGIQFEFDESLPSTPARLRLQDADFSTTVQVLAAITKTFVAPLEERVAIVALDTAQKRQEFERLVVQRLEVS